MFDKLPNQKWLPKNICSHKDYNHCFANHGKFSGLANFFPTMQFKHDIMCDYALLYM